MHSLILKGISTIKINNKLKLNCFQISSWEQQLSQNCVAHNISNKGVNIIFGLTENFTESKLLDLLADLLQSLKELDYSLKCFVHFSSK